MSIYGLPFQGNSFPVTSPYGPRPHLEISPYHHGIDFGTPLGTPLYAPSNGLLDYFGTEADGLGNYLRLLMPGGEQYYMGHLSEFAPDLSVGMPITAGTLLGYSGNTGRSTGAHTDIRIRDASGNYVDPTPYLGLDNFGQHPVDTLPENAVSRATEQMFAAQRPPAIDGGQQPMLGLLDDPYAQLGGLLGAGQQNGPQSAQGGLLSDADYPLLMAGLQLLANSQTRPVGEGGLFDGMPQAIAGGLQAQTQQAEGQAARQRQAAMDQLMSSLSPQERLLAQLSPDQFVASRFRGQGEELPATVRTAEWFLQQPEQVQDALRNSGLLGSPGVSVTVQGEQNAFDRAVGTAQGTRYTEFLTAGDAAAQTLGQINQFMPIIDAAQTGWGAETLAEAQRIAERFGWNVNLGDPDGIAQFQSLSGSFVLSLAEQLPGVMSDADLALLREQVASTGNSPATNRAIMTFVQQRAQWAADRARAAEQHVQQNGSMAGFTFAPIPPNPFAGSESAATGTPAAAPSSGLLASDPQQPPPPPPSPGQPTQAPWPQFQGWAEAESWLNANQDAIRAMPAEQLQQLRDYLTQIQALPR